MSPETPSAVSEVKKPANSKETVVPSEALTALKQEIVQKYDEGVIDKLHDQIKKGNRDIVKELNLSADQLIRLEDRHEGTLLYLYAELVDQKGNSQKNGFEQMQEFYKNPDATKSIKIDFMGHYTAEKEIGAADFLPPSIRQISVSLPDTYDVDEDNTLSSKELNRLQEKAKSRTKVRTSERRLGLKGQNQTNRGFYDKQGYIPIFTGDMVTFGNVDQSFEQKFRSSDASKNLNYTLYDQDAENEADRKFLEELRASGLNETALASTNLFTDEELRRSLESTSEYGQKIVLAAKSLAGKENFRGAHCWDWADKVYKAAGFTHREVFRNLGYSGRYGCPRDHCPSVQDLRGGRLQPGDWIFLNNQNSSDAKGNHSGIFLGWEDESTGLASIASCPGANKVGNIKTYNLSHEQVGDKKPCPVTWIAKPAPYRG